MRQLIQNLRTGIIEISEVPKPSLKANGIIVQTLYSVVSSGTERAIGEFAEKGLLGKAIARPDLARQAVKKAFVEGPASVFRKGIEKLEEGLALGYSSSGIVLEIGEGIAGIKEGDLAACGGGGYACHAEVVYIPKNLFVRVPENVSPEDAAFATVGAVALEGIRRAGLVPGDKVAVVGLGLIGRLTVDLLSAYGHPVIGIDNDEKKVAMTSGVGLGALSVGSNDVLEAIAEATDGYGVDATIITASTSSDEPVRLSSEITRQKGKVVAVGDVGLNVPRKPFYEKELDLSISRSYGPGRYDPSYEEKGIDYPYPYVRWTEKRNMQEFLRLVSEGKIRPSDLVTDSFPIERASEAYDLLKEKRGETLGILLSYPAEQPDYAEKKTVRFESKQPGKKAGDVVVGLIGGGNFTGMTLLPALVRLDGVKLRAIATASGRSAQRLAEKYGMEYATSDYGVLLEDKEIDLVYITTRHDLHARLAMECIDAGKAVHVEKPLAIDMESLAALAGLVSEKKGWVSAGFNRRNAPLAKDMKNFIGQTSGATAIDYRVSAGRLPPEHWLYDAKEGGGRLLGEACHFIDFLMYLIGEDASSVNVTTADSVDEFERVENALIEISLSDGSIGTVRYLAMGGNMEKERIEGYRGSRSVVINDFREGIFYDGSKKRRSKHRRIDKGHSGLLEAEINAIKKGLGPPIDFKEALLSSYITLMIPAALRSKEPIEIGFDNYFLQ